MRIRVSEHACCLRWAALLTDKSHTVTHNSMRSSREEVYNLFPLVLLRYVPL